MTVSPRDLSAEELARVRALVPDLDCKGLCARSCGRIFLWGTELALIEAETGRPIPVTPGRTQSGIPTLEVVTDKKGRCPMLRSGRCTIHESRPVACRVWGTTEPSRCPFGCEPSRMLSTDEAGELIARAAGSSFGHRVEGDPE